MGKITDFLAGIKVIEEIDSPINGRVSVVKSLAFGTYIQVGGLTQSGGIIKTIWNKTLSKVKNNNKTEFKKCLILGLGGGSLVEVVKFFYPNTRITAVDIDPIMVRLGKNHLNLDDKKNKVVISDAGEFVKKSLKKEKFDLVLVDLYLGDLFPEKFEEINFISDIKKILESDGIVIFNRLYYGKKRTQAVKFLKSLEDLFQKVEVVYPEANVMFVCYPQI
jgi:spermidine synthase